MNFRPRSQDEPEINLIPFIDVLLVILIFLMLTTTYSKFTELQLTLPVAQADAQRDRPREIHVTVTADSRFGVNQKSVDGKNVDSIARAMAEVTREARDNVVIISADAAAPHQSVVTVMEAARRVGLSQITFATQTAGSTRTAP